MINLLTLMCACALITANHEHFWKKWRLFQRLEYTTITSVDPEKEKLYILKAALV